MGSLSLCMIVKNESSVLKRCLDSVCDLADEIIIVDTGSSDDSTAIAKQFTDKIYSFKWIDDFAKARNYSFSKASKDFVMWLDADDVILEEDRKNFLNLKNKLSVHVHDIIMMKYNVAFDEHGNPTFSYFRERIVKNNSGHIWVGPVHEVIPLSSNILYSDISITHKKISSVNPKRNLEIFNKMLESGIELDSRQQFYYARELYYNGLYEKAIKEFYLFIARNDCWIENRITACQDLSCCYRHLKDTDMSLKSLLMTLEYDQPRAEICCDIGRHFFDQKLYKIAVFWYELALTRKYDEFSGGFKKIDCYGYIPYLQLCICYYRIGDIKKSIEYNELAARIKPNDSKVKYNREFFKTIDITDK